MWGTQQNFANHLTIGRSTLGYYIRGESFPPPAIAEKLYLTTHLEILKLESKSIPFPENLSQPNIPTGESGRDNGQATQKRVESKVKTDVSKVDANTNEAKFPQTNKESTVAERQELFIPVFGFVWLYPEELRVLDHPATQRLGHVNQLGLSYLVYRGATHKRLEHSIGTVHVAQRMINAVRHTTEKAQKLGCPHF